MKSTHIKVSELDWFFMSYNEPNAENNYSDLINKVPWVKRVDGIKGFDSVHRECGRLSETEWLITVDADTRIYEDFIDKEVTVYEQSARNLCWASKNFVNGLCYGNGGIKLWHKPFIENMSFHEFGDGVDFCWDRDYRAVNEVHSDVFINGSSEQAFRAGYREGMKLTTLRGQWIDVSQWNKLSPVNQRLVRVWCSLGQDVENGIYAILGARLGVIDNIEHKVSNENVSDFDYIKSRLESITDINSFLVSSEKEINTKTNLAIINCDPVISSFIKTNYA